MAEGAAIYLPVSGKNNKEETVIFDFVDHDEEDAAGDVFDSVSSDYGDGLIALPLHELNDNYEETLHREHAHGRESFRPMEISNSSFEEDFTEQLYSWKDPWLPTVMLLLLLVIPAQITLILTFHNLIGAWFAGTPFALHLLFVVFTAKHLSRSKTPTLQSKTSRFYTSIASAIDNITLGVIFPVVCSFMNRTFFTDLDGTIIIEWSRHKYLLDCCIFLSVTATVGRCSLAFIAIGLRAATASMDSEFTDKPTWGDRWCHLPSYILSPFLYLDSRLQKYCMCSLRSSQRKAIRRSLCWLFNIALTLAIGIFCSCFYSAFLHFGLWPPPPIIQADCDPLDETECWLPFPSFHSLIPDNTTITGWRVNMQGRLLPPLKTHRQIDPAFLNRLDGFSTMPNILFYLDGLKEAHVAGLSQLKGPTNIAESVTVNSITLLLDVSESRLVPHSAEIDYLDEQHPVVLMFPAEPLYHNRHYAVAVIGAKNATREFLSPTNGMKNLLFSDRSLSAYDIARKQRYTDLLIPSLEQAAPWFDYSSQPYTLQLLFDFHTISAESQLGPIRSVRDATIDEISSTDWRWEKHVRTIRSYDFDCSGNGSTLARTVHAELDVPWFLELYGPGGRSAFLDEAAVDSRKSAHLGSSKLSIHIPCSLKAAALGLEGAKPLRSVMEFGHGLFGDRGESSENVHLQMANDEGYLVAAMDWRGMSSFDLLVVVKVLVAQPSLFQAVRDGLIQGFACKFAMQHFVQHTLLSMEWLKFKRYDPVNGLPLPTAAIPTLNDKPPSQIFYGISQGGILGAGYTALSGPTGLIDRAILGSPGTPFTMIMTRSLDFLEYDTLLLFEFYINRHVRMLLSMVQMAWDPVEASGVLAKPVTESYPPVLIQTGLGDVIVSTFASEALARAYNASTVPANPHEIFGIFPQVTTSNATLTELVYDEEFMRLPSDNTLAIKNEIHYCTRYDKALIFQITKFINENIVIDPCTEDGCHRSKVECW